MKALSDFCAFCAWVVLLGLLANYPQWVLIAGTVVFGLLQLQAILIRRRLRAMARESSGGKQRTRVGVTSVGSGVSVRDDEGGAA